MVEYTTVIYYALYAIYIVWLLSDFDLGNIDGESLTWIIVFGLMLLIFAICIAYTLRITGYDLYFDETQLIIIFVVLIVLVGITLGCQWWNNMRTRNNIIRKVQTARMTPITYQYGRDSDEIGRRLHINDTDRFPPFGRTNPTTLQEMWETLMTRTSKDRIKEIVRNVLKEDLKDGIDVVYNLLWYLCISENPLGNNLTEQEIKHLVSLDVSQLRELFASALNYNGAQDRASLLFTALSGQVIPDPGNSVLASRYNEVKNYQPTIVYNLAFNQHRIIDHTNGVYSIHPPYIYLSQQPVSLVETLIATVNTEDSDDIIERFGIGSNDEISAASSSPALLATMTQDEKFRFIQGELSLYHNVVTRPAGMLQPPVLAGKTRDEIANLTSYYTNVELIQAYEPRGNWSSRNELIKLIQDDVTGTARWSFVNKYCTNDDTMNIMSGEQHGDINKDDIEDPTLSFGVHKNYRCYQVSELEGSFREYDGTFMFHVPDWTQGAIDSITGTPLAREFPVDSIKQLHILLQRFEGRYNVVGLIGKIEEGLNILKSARMQTLHFKRQYDGFTPEQKIIVDKYLAWMFMYAMWMRFWKGPGHPWPVSKVNVRRESERNRAHRSSPEERDEHVFVQEAVRTSIIESYENDPMLLEWINALPAIYYDFDTGDAKCASYPIKQILDRIALGDYCMGFGSDTILKTSYHYIINMLDKRQGVPFNDFITSMFPSILDLEYRVVTTQLDSVTREGVRHRVLNARLQNLQQPIPVQPGFDPSNYQNNMHIE